MYNLIDEKIMFQFWIKLWEHITNNGKIYSPVTTGKALSVLVVYMYEHNHIYYLLVHCQ